MITFKEKLQGKPVDLQKYLNPPQYKGVDGDGKSIVTVDAEDMKYNGETIFTAAEKGKLEMVAMFLMGGVDPNARELGERKATPIHYAAVGGDITCAAFLLDNGADINARNGTPESEATVKEGRDGLGYGQTPLMWAAANGRLDVINVLVQKGADVHAIDRKGFHAGFHAVNHPLSLHLLFTNGLNLKLKDPDGRTLLHFSASAGNRHSIHYVLDKCSELDINEKESSEGFTPLHYAVEAKSIHAVKALMLRGASASIKNAKGLTPLDMPECTHSIRKFVQAFEAAGNATLKERLAAFDGSNFSAIDKYQIMHVTAAFLIPNLAVMLVSNFSSDFAIFGLLAVLILAVGFVFVANFGMKMKKRSLATAGWYFGALFFGSLILLRDVFPQYEEYYPESPLPFWWWISTPVMTICYVRAVMTDPGAIQGSTQQRNELYEKVSKEGEAVITRDGYCTTCMLQKPLRSKHCSNSGFCVYRFDHYCVWTGNAIGSGNHRPFLLFSMFQFVAQSMVAITSMTTLFYIRPKKLNYTFDGVCSVGEWLLGHDNQLLTFFMLFYNTFVFLFVTAVCVQQLQMVARNVTSNETWFADRYRWMFRLGSTSYNLFDKGIRQNYLEFWTGNLAYETYTVPEMNSYLRDKAKRYAEQMKASQEAQRARMMAGGAHGHSHDGGHGHSHGGGGHGHSHGGSEQALLNSGGFNPAQANAEQLQTAVSQMPKSQQDEITAVQTLLKKLVQGDQTIEPPAGYPAEKGRQMVEQARQMFTHYQAMMSAQQQMMRQQQQQQHQ